MNIIIYLKFFKLIKYKWKTIRLFLDLKPSFGLVPKTQETEDSFIKNQKNHSPIKLFVKGIIKRRKGECNESNARKCLKLKNIIRKLHLIIQIILSKQFSANKIKYVIMLFCYIFMFLNDISIELFKKSKLNSFFRKNRKI